MITINLANDENDDWMKKADPNYRTSEDKAHAGALALHEQEVAEAEKEVVGYVLVPPSFYPDPWPEPDQVNAMVDNMDLLGLTWADEVQLYKDSHHLEGGKWVSNA